MTRNLTTHLPNKKWEHMLFSYWKNDVFFSTIFLHGVSASNSLMFTAGVTYIAAYSMTSSHLWPSSSQRLRAVFNEITDSSATCKSSIWDRDIFHNSVLNLTVSFWLICITLHELLIIYTASITLWRPSNHISTLFVVNIWGFLPHSRIRRGNIWMYFPPLDMIFSSYPINVNKETYLGLQSRWRSRLNQQLVSKNSRRFCLLFYFSGAQHILCSRSPPRLDIRTAPPRFKFTTQHVSPFCVSPSTAHRACCIYVWVHEGRCERRDCVRGEASHKFYGSLGTSEEEMNLVM